MPTDKETIKNFFTRLSEKSNGSERTPIAIVDLTKKTIEDMGYNYDMTLLHWIFNVELQTDHDNLGFLDTIVKLVISHFEEIKNTDLLANETINIIETYFNLPMGGMWMDIVIDALLECERTGDVIQYDDFIVCLQNNGSEAGKIKSNGLIQFQIKWMESSGFIKFIAKQNNGMVFFDISVLNKDGLVSMREKLNYIDYMRQKYIK
jgi:hypothetical protein